MIFTPTSDCRAESICENPYGIIKDYWRVLGAYNNQQEQESQSKESLRQIIDLLDIFKICITWIVLETQTHQLPLKILQAMFGDFLTKLTKRQN